MGIAQVPVLRKNGADGEITVRWRTIGENELKSKNGTQFLK